MKYCVVWETHIDHIEATINQLAQEGWEVVNTWSSATAFYACLRKANNSSPTE